MLQLVQVEIPRDVYNFALKTRIIEVLVLIAVFKEFDIPGLHVVQHLPHFEYHAVPFLSVINNFRGFYDVKLDEIELKALLAYLNSNVGQQVIQTQTQPQQGGYEKLSISALNELPVIDPTSLEEPIVATLADLFDELCETAGDSSDCELVLESLDSLLQQVM